MIKIILVGLVVIVVMGVLFDFIGGLLDDAQKAVEWVLKDEEEDDPPVT